MQRLTEVEQGVANGRVAGHQINEPANKCILSVRAHFSDRLEAALTGSPRCSWRRSCHRRLARCVPSTLRLSFYPQSQPLLAHHPSLCIHPSPLPDVPFHLGWLARLYPGRQRAVAAGDAIRPRCCEGVVVELVSFDVEQHAFGAAQDWAVGEVREERNLGLLVTLQM